MEDPSPDAENGLIGRGAAADLPIKELGLRTRTTNALLSGGFSTTGGLLAALEAGDGALTRLGGFGDRSLVEVKGRLGELGLLEVAEAPVSSESVELPPGGAAIEPPGAPPTESPTVPMPAMKVPMMGAAPTEKAPVEKMPDVAALAADGAGGLQMSSFGQRLQATFAQAGGRLVVVLLGLVGIALILVALFLPPVSLLERLGVFGYTALDAENSQVTHPDGLTVSVDPDSFSGKLRLRLSSVPRLKLLEGSAGAGRRKAVEALPEHLAVKSPLYEIRTRGTSSGPVQIDVTVPNDAEPWRTLDLYTWNGDAWEWIGSELHTEVAEQEFIRATVTEVPDSVVVVQAGSPPPVVAAYLTAGDNPVSTAGGAVDEVHPVGLIIGTLGGFAGSVDDLPQPDDESVAAVVPTLRNWAPGASVNRGLLSDMLAMPKIQQDHITNIVQLCVERGFAGVEVDYRGAALEERDAYTAFIRTLADALHIEGLRLDVVLEPPMPVGGGWDMGGYDWAAIGAAADVVKVPFPADPATYGEGGEVQRLLDWATGRVPRHKLRMVVSSLSAEQSSEGVEYVSLDQALAPFGEVVALGEIDQVKPGTQLDFGLSGALLSITRQEGSGTYRLEHMSDDGETHATWLGTAASLAAKLRWAQQYHLGGVAVADLLHAGNAESISAAVEAYRAGTDAPAGQTFEVAWSVAGAQEQVSPLTDPRYSWMVLATSGSYEVGASIAGFEHGSVIVTVAEPAAAAAATTAMTTTTGVTETVELTETVEAAPALTETEEVTSSVCLDATFVADVTIPDNTQLGNEEEFEKTWRVRNNGSCAWPEDAVLAFASGEQMGAPESVEVGAVEPGEQVDIPVQMKAPADPGQYKGTWRMKSVDGFYGGGMWVVILAGEQEQEQDQGTGTAVVVAPVSGGSFELGGHVRDTGLPHADRMHYAGMNWTKVQVHYGQDASGMVAAAHSKGFKIQLSALGSPDMVTKGGFESDYAGWVAGLAAAGADAIEVWNEPNIDREWAVGHISPQAYTQLLCAAYNAIKGANAGTAVISAAPAPTGWFGGCGPNGCDDMPWMAGLRDAGAANCMDFIGAHHNSGATSPAARSGHPADPGSTHHSWFFLPQTELYYNTFGGARKLFYTEMGYASQEGVEGFHDAFAWARGTNNAQQAQWLAEAVSLSVNTGMVRCIIVWNIDFVRYGYDPQDGFAILRPGGACPACESLHAVLGTR